MKKFNLIYLILCIFVLCGCSKEIKATINKVEPLGKIIDVQICPTSFNEQPTVLIKTEKAAIVIVGRFSVDLAKEARRVEWSDGRKTFEWDGAKCGYYY